jgi:hypothetical protein
MCVFSTPPSHQLEGVAPCWASGFTTDRLSSYLIPHTSTCNLIVADGAACAWIAARNNNAGGVARQPGSSSSDAINNGGLLGAGDASLMGAIVEEEEEEDGEEVEVGMAGS